MHRFASRPVVTCLFGLSCLIVVAGCDRDQGATDQATASPSAPEDTTSSTAPSRDAASADQLFDDATDALGITFSHDTGAGGALLFPEMMGGGIAMFDADGDRDLDLYFVSGAPELGRVANDQVSNRLLLQAEDGRFIDHTAASGLGDTGYGTGVAIGDIDNDGQEDVFVANFGPDRLYRGLGGGRFADATARSGIAATGTRADDWSTSAAFCDVDRDGHLDLYVVRYVVYDPSVRCTDPAGRHEYCGPSSFAPRTDVLLRNQGDGTFRDITRQASIEVATGAGLGLVCEDFDDDGWVDIYVANDGDPNQLWMNQGDGTFIDDALIMGSSVNAAGLYEAGMGVVAADFDNDTDFDLFITHLRDETNTYYRNVGSGAGFEDQTASVGLASSSTPFTGFGTAAFDIDLDADLDLVIANGRVTRGEPLTSTLAEPWSLYAEPNLLYLNQDGAFVPADDHALAFTAQIEVSRGLAIGDVDGDGALDLAVSNIGSRARLYLATPPASHWLLVDAIDPSLGRRALGARVTVEAGGQKQVRTIQSAMSYLSSSDPRAHFGLGTIDSVERITVRWPGGEEESFDAPDLDRAIVLQRGEGRS